MAEISRDWKDNLDKDMRRSYLSVQVIQLLAGLIFFVGAITTAASNSAMGISWIIASALLFLITQAAEDIRKNRVASQSLLELQIQQSLYLSEVKTLLNESATYNERLLMLQTKQSRSLNAIEALLAELATDNERETSESEVTREDLDAENNIGD
jgi:hypothetical protein